MDRTVEKYLTNHAEPEVQLLPGLLPDLPGHQHCLVIPAYRETWSGLQKVWRDLPTDVLVIAVVNAPTANDAATAQLADEAFASSLSQIELGNISLLHWGTGRDLLLVDRYSTGNTIPAKQGVGLARKIGADLALALIADGRITTPRIALTDADAELPADYFAPPMHEGDAALVYPFIHHSTDELTDAMLLYEISMLYYAAGLKWAGSYYGFTTIGSLITVNPKHYAMVRGFPKRNAGEDFYLLNKLAKTGAVRAIAAPTVRIEARVSDRVPFGTGPGLRRILALTSPTDEYLFYNPVVFVELRRFLAALPALWNGDDLGTGFENGPILQFCNDLGFFSTVQKRKSQIKSTEGFGRFLTDWFDGFRTLKFIHELRKHYPSVKLSEIRRAPFVNSFDPPIGSSPANREQLTLLRDYLATRCLDGVARAAS